MSMIFTIYDPQLIIYGLDEVLLHAQIFLGMQQNLVEAVNDKLGIVDAEEV